MSDKMDDTESARKYANVTGFIEPIRYGHYLNGRLSLRPEITALRADNARLRADVDTLRSVSDDDDDTIDRLREALEGDTLTAKRVYQLIEQRDALAEENEKLKAAMERIQAMVDRQAEDEGLWATPLHRQLTIGEAHTQQELRELHALIEMFSKTLADAGRGREGSE